MATPCTLLHVTVANSQKNASMGAALTVTVQGAWLNARDLIHCNDSGSE
jgi:hypothetical protein